MKYFSAVNNKIIELITGIATDSVFLGMLLKLRGEFQSASCKKKKNATIFSRKKIDL